MVQISRMLKKANQILSQESVDLSETLSTIYGIKLQTREILSFLNPRSIAPIYAIIDLLETKLSKTEVKHYYERISDNQLKIVSLLKAIEEVDEIKEVRDILDSLRILNHEMIGPLYKEEDKALDLLLMEELEIIANNAQDEVTRETILKLKRVIKRSIMIELPTRVLRESTVKNIKKKLHEYCAVIKTRLNESQKFANFTDLFELDSNVTELCFETLYLGKRDKDKEIKVATQWEIRNDQRLIDTDYIDEDLQRARQAWKKVISLSEAIPARFRDSFIELEREKHFGNYPRLKKLQGIINKINPSVDDIIELMNIAPYAKFNIENFAKEQGVDVKDIFTEKFQANRISLLSTDKLKKHKLTNREFAGECFAKKKVSHGLYSNSNIYVWLRKELDPFTLIYTAGHELIHYQQLKNSMNAEKRALKDGGKSLAKFLNYYGNFLGANERTLDNLDYESSERRKPLYGYADRCTTDKRKAIVRDLNSAIRTSNEKWDQVLDEYGSLFNYMMPSSPATRVKALQEVLPALENAKNILFAKELGLDLPYCPVAAALPTANQEQKELYCEEVIHAAKSIPLYWEGLRIIASHQYHGVSFARADRDEDSLMLKPTPQVIAMGSSYNQTQQ